MIHASTLARRAPLGTLTPGHVSPRRAVPEHIERPEYMFHSGPEVVTASDVKDPETVERIRRAGRIAADAMELVGEAVRPGVTTEELDRIGHEYMIAHDAYPSTLGYMGYAKSLCTSVNEVICHGIPDDTVLEEGDIVNVDVTAFKDGMHGDTNRTFLVGEVSQEARDLVERTHEAMMRGIRACRPGRQTSVIGHVIEAYANRFGYGTVREYTGHGVGREFHSGLIIPHYDDPDRFTDVIEENMVFTVEPMLTLGSARWKTWSDDWTVTTADLSLTAQFEHTIVIRPDGPEILTASLDGTV